MDTLIRDQEVIKSVIRKYAQLRPSHGDIRLDAVFDEGCDRYALMQVGWDRGRRIHGNLIYITLQANKVWVEYDGMETGILNDLVAGGIPEDRIVLAFLPEKSAAMSR
jgi:hypothetical protein